MSGSEVHLRFKLIYSYQYMQWMFCLKIIVRLKEYACARSGLNSDSPNYEVKVIMVINL